MKMGWDGRFVGIQLSRHIDEDAVQNGDDFCGEVDQLRVQRFGGGEGAQVAAVQIQAGLSVRDELRDFADVRGGLAHLLVCLEVEQELAIDGHDLCDDNVRADLHVQNLRLGVEGVLRITNEESTALRRQAIRCERLPFWVLQFCG